MRESLGYLYSTHQPADLEDLGGLAHNDNGFLIYRLHFTSCVGILMKKMTFPPNKDEHVSSLDQRGKRSLIWPNSFEVHSHLAFHIPWVCAHCSLRGRERERGEKRDDKESHLSLALQTFWRPSVSGEVSWLPSSGFCSFHARFPCPIFWTTELQNLLTISQASQTWSLSI